MELRYDIPEYIALTKMSSKARILVEGKDDRGIILGLISRINPKIKFSVDSAVDIKGNCSNTAKNNRAKIEKIHLHCKEKDSHEKLFFLCDREFRKFEIDESIKDLVQDHEVDRNLVWTEGHSLENYFLSPSMLIDGFRFLTGAGQKDNALQLFEEIFYLSLREIATLTLAAKIQNCASFPSTIIQWKEISITGNSIDIGLRKLKPENSITERFIRSYFDVSTVIAQTPIETCARFCRGHTAVIALQRIFAACLYTTTKITDEEIARYDANLFNNIPESTIRTALSESWISGVSKGEASYPAPLVRLLHNVA